MAIPATSADGTHHQYTLAFDLPPVSDLRKIFKDLAEKALKEGLQSALDAFGGRCISIATMCSGTEAPIIATRMASEALADMGCLLNFQHMFSAEIVPFKQAFIERNFAPPILFRNIGDVADKDKAETAYGGLRDVPPPGSVDLLVAGFACVDFSNLNNQKKDLQLANQPEHPTTGGMGESSDTLQAIIRYAEKYRPRVIILENVMGAPWEKVCDAFRTIEYAARSAKVDTKDFYIPHTRQRTYMIAVSQRSHSGEAIPGAEAAVARWAEVMKALKRPASSVVDDFLLPHGDPILDKATADLIRPDGMRPSDWAICHGRHLKTRGALQLGDRTPYTRWRSGVTCMPEWAIGDWGKSQQERVRDTMDIFYLENAAQGHDTKYKARFPDLSQNVDRQLDRTGAGKGMGITGCVTPNGIIYHTARGGRLVGLEALALQGLPIQQLHLTRESQRDLADLAGNAMTSTVVGASIMAAIASHHGIMDPAREHPEPEKVPEPLISDGRLLVQHTVSSHGKDAKFDSAELMAEAAASVSACFCEGVSDISTTLYRCTSCESTVCDHCKGNPDHEYEAFTIARQDPDKLIQRLFNEMPCRLTLDLEKRHFVRAYDHSVAKLTESNEDDRDLFLEALTDVFGQPLYFRSVSRHRQIKVNYESESLHLRLFMDGSKLQWKLWAKADPDLPGNSRIRALLKYPIATMEPTNSLVTGQWQIRIPVYASIPMTVVTYGTQVPSWRSELGLQKFRNEQVWSELEIGFPATLQDERMTKIAGRYQLLPKCGTATRALHVKCTEEGERMYLFLDANRYGRPDYDRFAFATDCRRVQYGEEHEAIAHVGIDPFDPPTGSSGRPATSSTSSTSGRPVIASRPRKAAKSSASTSKVDFWRPPGFRGLSKVECVLNGEWSLSDAALRPSTESVLVERLDTDNIAPICLKNERCHDASFTIVDCQIPWSGPNPDGRTHEKSIIITERNQQSMVFDASWLTRTVFLEGQDQLLGWQALSVLLKAEDRDTLTGRFKCGQCPTVRPRIRWAMKGAGKLVPYEDQSEARAYEIAVHNAPSPIIIETQIRRTLTPICDLRIHFNFHALVHHALASFPNFDPATRYEISWRLDTQFTSNPRVTIHPFKIPSNQADEPTEWEFSGESDGTQFKLRPEQQRSLTWMLEQDKEDCREHPESVVEECFSTHLGWRLDVKSSRPRTIRGGIIADEIGYGKTVTMLALINKTSKGEEGKTLDQVPGFISLKATLVIVPATLVPQWETEIARFWPECNVIAITSVGMLAKLDIRKLLDADIVICPLPVLTSAKYIARIAQLAGMPEPPKLTTARHCTAFIEHAQARLQETIRYMVDMLSIKGADEIVAWLIARILSFQANKATYNLVPSKRYKGKEFSEHKRATQSAHTAVEAESDSELTEERLPIIEGFGEAKTFEDVIFPVLNIFLFRRKVVDEQTYASDEQVAAVNSIRASSTFILSATPGFRDFIDVKRAASLIGLFLGVDDEAKETAIGENLKALVRERTEFEKFESYKTSRSPAWHSYRRSLAQEFIDRFARRNFAKIAKIPCEIYNMAIAPSPTHRAIYLEMAYQLLSNESRASSAKFMRKSDRIRRLNLAISDAASCEEALAEATSIFHTDTRKRQRRSTVVPRGRDQECATMGMEMTDVQAKTHIHRVRTNDLHRLATEFKILAKIIDKLIVLGGDDPCQRLCSFIQQLRTGVYGDPTFSTWAEEVYSHLTQSITVAEEVVERGRRKKPTTWKPMKLEADEIFPPLMETLHSVAVGVVIAIRCLRFLDSAILIQGGTPGARADCQCGQIQSLNLLWVNVDCGHITCKKCHRNRQDEDECAVDGCHGRVAEERLLEAKRLKSVDPYAAPPTTFSKLEAILQLVADDYTTEKVIVFSQYDNITDLIEAGLEKKGTDCCRIKTAQGNKALTDGVFRKNMAAMRRFHDDDNAKVLLLNPIDSSAAGHNLTNASVIVFVSPILAENQLKFDSYLSQAVGRAVRFGQKKMVKIHHFMTVGTRDIDLAKEFGGSKPRQMDGDTDQQPFMIRPTAPPEWDGY